MATTMVSTIRKKKKKVALKEVPKKPRGQQLSEKSITLLDSFDASAKHWGCMDGYGSGKPVVKAEKVYSEDKAALTKHILQLEKDKKRLTAKVRELSPAKCEPRPPATWPREDKSKAKQATTAPSRWPSPTSQACARPPTTWPFPSPVVSPKK